MKMMTVTIFTIKKTHPYVKDQIYLKSYIILINYKRSLNDLQPLRELLVNNRRWVSIGIGVRIVLVPWIFCSFAEISGNPKKLFSIVGATTN
jgi:hypothetical protein